MGVARQEPFFVIRQNINEEGTTDAPVEILALKDSRKYKSEDEQYHYRLGFVQNFRIVKSKIYMTPDGKKRVEVLARWDDIPGAESYEIWHGRKKEDSADD